jgi:hypothetical protein
VLKKFQPKIYDLGEFKMATTLMATVVSDPEPQPGQKHRSSGNFSTESMPENPIRWKWVVTGHPNCDAICFNVKHDIKAAIDTVWFKDVYNGKQTKNNMKKEGSLYISDPSNANGQKFNVSVYAVTR